MRDASFVSLELIWIVQGWWSEFRALSASQLTDWDFFAGRNRSADDFLAEFKLNSVIMPLVCDKASWLRPVWSFQPDFLKKTRSLHNFRQELKLKLVLKPSNCVVRSNQSSFYFKKAISSWFIRQNLTESWFSSKIGSGDDFCPIFKSKLSFGSLVWDL